MDLRLSTSRPRLFSETVVFFSSTVYRYLRCVRESLLRDCDEERNQLLEEKGMDRLISGLMAEDKVQFIGHENIFAFL